MTTSYIFPKIRSLFFCNPKLHLFAMMKFNKKRDISSPLVGERESSSKEEEEEDQ